MAKLASVKEWVGGVVEIPQYVTGEGGEPFRPNPEMAKALRSGLPESVAVVVTHAEGTLTPLVTAPSLRGAKTSAKKAPRKRR